MFILRIISLSSSSIYRVLFIRRFYYVMYSGVVSNNSPVELMYRACVKYNILDYVIGFIESGKVPSKSLWKQMVKNAIKDVIFATWRFELKLYPKLSLYRAIVTDIKPICWWNIAKVMPFLKQPCVTVVKLISGSNILAINSQSNLPRDERLCVCCNDNQVENVDHFVLKCSYFRNIREMMFFIYIFKPFCDWEACMG